MLDVFFTVDVEIWCDGWLEIDQRFPEAFQRYIYGPTPHGDYGLPYQLRLLSEHGLRGVFFIEPLFAARFGRAPLGEIVGLVLEAGHEVQLHLHTEWVDEAREPLLEGTQQKRQHLRYFSLAEQKTLIATGARMLRAAGAREIGAFRAGSFGFNRDTLRALTANGIAFDSSYNASMFGLDSGVLPGVSVVEPIKCEGVYEYPMTVFLDGSRKLRHAQLTACSYEELEGLMWQALERERSAFVILSHGSELLNRAKDRADDVVVRRFRRLCAFLERNSDSFCVRGFQGLTAKVAATQPVPLAAPLWRTGKRLVEQAYRWKYR